MPDDSKTDLPLPKAEPNNSGSASGITDLRTGKKLCPTAAGREECESGTLLRFYGRCAGKSSVGDALLRKVGPDNP